MLVITAIQITEQEAVEHDVVCNMVDHGAIQSAEIRGLSTFEGCPQIPVYSVAFKPAEDMVIPLFLCTIHFNALKLSLHEGVAVDEDIFGKFPNH